VNIPPRTMKSLIVSVFWPVWEWATRPATRWLFSSYSAGVSTRDSLKCRRIIESTWYQSRWGNIFRLTGDQNVKTGSRTTDRVPDRNVGGSTSRRGWRHPRPIDPHNLKEIHSDSGGRACSMVRRGHVDGSTIRRPGDS
jgi:hypothetical protein